MAGNFFSAVGRPWGRLDGEADIRRAGLAPWHSGDFASVAGMDRVGAQLIGFNEIARRLAAIVGVTA